MCYRMLVFLVLVSASLCAYSDQLKIASFDGTGLLCYNTLNDGNNYNYRVEWAPSPVGPWSDFASSGANWLGGRPQVADTAITNFVPMCYRVVATLGDYMVIDISGGTNATSYPVTYYRTLADVPGGANSDAYKTTHILMRLIPRGVFMMGSHPGEFGRYSNETQHTVTLTRDFYIGVFEVTQRQWELVMGNRPSYFTNSIYYASRPVDQVSYYDLRENPANVDDLAVNWPDNQYVNNASFMGKLRAKTGMLSLDLPTEAQWEYACRAGSSTALNTGYNIASAQIDPRMGSAGRYWYNGGSGHTPDCSIDHGTAKAGSYPPNAYGVYDMHGNAWEWCLDWSGLYSGNGTDPAGATSGAYRVVRGGGWTGTAIDCRAAHRYVSIAPDSRSYYFGFRVAMTTQ